MDNAVESRLGSDFEMLVKEFALLRLILSILFESSRSFVTGQTVVIETSFAQRHHFRVPSEFSEALLKIRRCLEGIGGMPSHHGEHIRKTFGKLNGSLAAFEIRADADDFNDPSRLGPVHHLI